MASKLDVLRAANKWKKRRFNYGEADCCQWAGFVVKELTGVDYLESFSYQDEASAYKIIEGNGSLKHTVSSVLGPPSKTLSDGDPCLVRMSTGDLMGIKLGDKILCLCKNGIIQIDQDNLICGWNKCRMQ